MIIELGPAQLLYISVFCIWYGIGFFFSSQEHGGGYFGRSQSRRFVIRLLTLLPMAIFALVFHLVVLT